MLKWAGILCLSGACILSGQCMARKLKERLRLMEQMEKYLILIKGDISYGQMTISQILQPLIVNAEGIFREFFQELVERMDAFDGRSLSDIWQEAVNHKLADSALQNEDLKLLCEICQFLGMKDAESEIAALEHQLSLLEYRIQDIRSQMPGKVMVARTIGITSGIFLAVLLI